MSFFIDKNRKVTVAKRDKNQASGSGGGSKFKYSKIDEFVLDIVGRESATVEGLKNTETRDDFWGWRYSAVDCLKRTKLKLEIEELKKRNMSWDLQNRKLKISQMEVGLMENRSHLAPNAVNNY